MESKGLRFARKHKLEPSRDSTYSLEKNHDRIMIQTDDENGINADDSKIINPILATQLSHAYTVAISESLTLNSIMKLDPSLANLSQLAISKMNDYVITSHPKQKYSIHYKTISLKS